MTPVHYWVIGAGRFGKRALNELLARKRSAHIVLVDRCCDALAGIREARVRTVCMDGADFLDRMLLDGGRPDWIIPALPVHLAFEWVRRRIEKTGRIERLPVPPSLERSLPNVWPGRKGELFVSHADFICPPDCLEPAGTCTVTGRPRPANLYDVLGGLSAQGLQTVVLRSRQLSAGTGGYRPKALFAALEGVEKARSDVLLATACRCHGVLQIFRVHRSSRP